MGFIGKHSTTSVISYLPALPHGEQTKDHLTRMAVLVESRGAGGLRKLPAGNDSVRIEKTTTEPQRLHLVTLKLLVTVSSVKYEITADKFQVERTP